MTDKLYSQQEVDERERLAQSAALKEASQFARNHWGDSDWLADQILTLSDQSLLAKHDAEMREDKIDRLAAKLNSVQEDYLRLYTKFHKQSDALRERIRRERLEEAESHRNVWLKGEFGAYNTFSKERIDALRSNSPQAGGKEPINAKEE